MTYFNSKDKNKRTFIKIPTILLQNTFSRLIIPIFGQNKRDINGETAIHQSNFRIKR